MAQYFEDWSGNAISAEPAGWTKRFVDTGVTYNIVSDTDAVAPAGLKLIISATTSQRRLLAYDLLDSDANNDQLKIAIMVKAQPIGGASVGLYGGGRGSNLTASSSINFAGAGYASLTTPDDLRSIFYVNGAATQGSGVVHGVTAGEWCWMRVELSSSHIEVTIAKVASPETIIATTSFSTGAILGTGWGGLFAFRGPETWEVGAVGFGTNGDEAPLSAVAAGQTISADVGTFLLTGQAVTFGVGMPLSAGAFALTGQDVSFSQGTNMSADVGTMLLTGQAVAFDVALTAAAGSFAHTGQDATLTDDTPQDRTISADFGTFLLTGQDVDLIAEASFTLVADAGSFVHTGQALVFDTKLVARAPSEFNDNFDGEAANITLGSHTPSYGTAWTQVDGSADAAFVSATNNSLHNNSNASLGATFLIDDQGTVDHYIQYDARDDSITSFVVNRVTDNSNFIGVRIVANAIEVWKRVAGTFTNLISASAGSSLVNIGDTIRFVSNGNVHSVFINGVFEADATDSFNNTVTRQGIVARLAGNTEWLDNLYAGPIGDYLLTGQDVTFTQSDNRTLSADAGSYVLTGQDVDFILSGVQEQDQGAGGGAGGDYWDQREKYLKYLKETYNPTVKKTLTVKKYVPEDKPSDFEYLRNVEILIAQKAESRIEFNRAVSNVIELSEIIDKLNRQQQINDIIIVLLLDS